MGKLELVIESDNVSIYSPKYDGETQTEFEKFMSDNGELENPQLKKDFDAIIAAIKKIIDDCGARENLFRPEGNNIKAIPLNHIRLPDSEFVASSQRIPNLRFKPMEHNADLCCC